MQIALPPSDIAQRQDEPGHVDMVAAWKRLYSVDKMLTTAWFAGALLLTIDAVVAVSLPSNLGATVGLLALLVAPLEVLLLPVLQRGRTTAAQVQEQFDCEVLQLPWNEAAAQHPDKRTIELAAEAYRSHTPKDEAFRRTHGWYENQVARSASAPLALARLACQRENVRWDSGQRRRFAAVLFVVVGIILGAVILFAVLVDSHIRQFLFGPVLLSSPLVVTLLRIAMEHRDVASQKERLADVLCRLEEDAQRPGADPADVLRRTRDVQTEIYHSRADDTPVPDWFYKLVEKQNRPPQS